MPLPPGLEGWVLSQNQTREREGGDIRNLAGILSIQGALESQRQAALLHPLQLQQLQDKINAEKRKDAALASLAELIGGNQSAASQGALAQGGAAGDVGPTVTNAQRMGVLQQNNLPAIDRGLASATLAGVDPKVGSFLRDIAVPKMETSGGYAFDPRRVQSGFLPQMQIGREGQATVSIPGAGGIPNIFAPPGALETFGAYKDIGNASEARYKPFEVKPTSASQNPTIMSTLDVLGGGQPRPGPAAPAAPPPLPPAMVGRPQAEIDAYRQVEAAGNTPLSVTVPSGAAPSVSAPSAPVPTRSVVGTPSGMSPQQEYQTAAEAAAATATGKERAEGGVKFEQGVLDAGRSAQGNLTNLQIVAPNLDKLPTGPMYPMLLNMKGYLNQIGLSVDPNLGPAQATNALLNQMALNVRNPSSGAGMPGAMSDADREFLLKTIPNLANAPDGNRQLVKILMGLEQRKIDEASIVNKMQAASKSSNEIRDALAQYANRNSIAAGLR